MIEDIIKQEARQYAAEVVRNTRLRMGLTQEEFAERCGMTRQHVCAIENGKYNIRLDTLFYMAKNLGCELEISLYSPKRRIRERGKCTIARLERNSV